MVNVLLFAELQETVGREKLTFDVDGITVKQLKDQWLSTYNLVNIDDAMVAINEEYADEDAVISAGDTVAFIPPVSGG
ncbi:MAG TPA: molybdopterin converting factor subunit 1 [Bacillota bacterium]|nr:molybdopterin converting factor subunit 1 [Bacillota bacterium]